MTVTEYGYRMTLYRAQMVNGVKYIMDECPDEFVGDWVAVQTYYEVPNEDPGWHYQEKGVVSIRPAMIMAFETMKDCEVIM